MVQCPTCGSKVSDNASVCSECGMDLKEAALPFPNVPGLRLDDLGGESLDFNENTLPESGVPPSPASLVPKVAPLIPIVPGAAATLTLKRGGVITSHVFPLGDFVMVGRFDPDSGPIDVDLGPLPESTYISRRHAEIRKDNTGQWYIKDLGASNGTFFRVAGQGQFQRITGEQPINSGDELALGNARFEFRVG